MEGFLSRSTVSSKFTIQMLVSVLILDRIERSLDVILRAIST